MPMLATPSAKTNRTNRAVRMAMAMADEVDSRLSVAAQPSQSMKLFNGIPNHYSGPLSAATPNPDCWLHDLRDQLTFFYMKATNDRTQSFNATPLGDRFCLAVGHGGPSVGTELTWLKSDGTEFTTTISHWINEYPAADISIYVLADPLPAWVNRLPILSLTADDIAAMAEIDPPTVWVTQGKYKVPLQEPPAFPYGYYNAPDNRMVAVKQLDEGVRPSLREPFYHFAVSGDSGQSECVLINGTLYLFGIITFYGGGRQQVAPRLPYINTLIQTAATAAGIPPITVAATHPQI